MKNRLLQPESSRYSINRAQPLVLVFSVGIQQKSTLFSSGNRSLDCCTLTQFVTLTLNEKKSFLHLSACRHPDVYPVVGKASSRGITPLISVVSWLA
jgi:hypothetical protein